MPTRPQNFLSLPNDFSSYERSRFTILPIPYDGAASYKSGARHGPAAIIEASAHIEEWDDELHRAGFESGIATLDPLELNVEGPQAMHEDIYAAAQTIVQDGKFLFGLGGDHSVSSGLVRAVMGRYEKLSMLQIDAHLDLRDTFQGSKYSHACVMRRIVDLGTSISPVGIRSIAEEEWVFMQSKKINITTARTCHTDDGWIDRVVQSLGENVYITIDIDGFDPAHAPGTGTPEPGGLNWYQVTKLLHRVAAERNVVAADLVEVMPTPGQVVTELLAARLTYKLINYVEHRSLLT